MICSAVWLDVVIVIVVMGILGGSSVACSRDITQPVGEMETTYFASMLYAYMTCSRRPGTIAVMIKPICSHDLATPETKLLHGLRFGANMQKSSLFV